MLLSAVLAVSLDTDVCVIEARNDSRLNRNIPIRGVGASTAIGYLPLYDFKVKFTGVIGLLEVANITCKLLHFKCLEIYLPRLVSSVRVILVVLRLGL